ncbi:hypothetical protein EW146_g3335 [Bondarzewia mesenterica]|uniref:PAN2-PAN3 deadenylation complex subunit PAN3 n=1 Tax=Bondarzewia mesenterica TaxID=1095465 RepID=A0A4S4LY49_9AGAM|nr:hypothetical protein EW146_g3335 [Bondarzewia mesenterica]
MYNSLIQLGQVDPKVLLAAAAGNDDDPRQPQYVVVLSSAIFLQCSYSTQRQCRNILIYGSCKFQDKGCIYYHPPRATTPPPPPPSQPQTPSSGTLSQAVNAPVFIPRASSLPPTSPTPTRAQAQSPLNASNLSSSPPPAEYDVHEPYDPNYYYDSENGQGPLSADDLSSQMQDMMMSSEYEGGHVMDYYPPQPTFMQAPLSYHLYSLPPPSPPTSHFISPTLRTDLQQHSETLRTAPAPGLNLPEELQGYHTLVPLENTTGERRKFGTWYSTVYRATGKDDRGYALRRVENYRLMHQAAFTAIEQWSQIRHPNIVSVHEAFTTRSFGDNSLVVAYTYHPNAVTLYDAHIKPKSPTFQNGRLQVPSHHIPERTIWSYIVQIASAIKVVHAKGLAVRMIDVTKVLVTGKNRVRIASCGLADVLTYNPAHSAPIAPGTPTNGTSTNLVSAAGSPLITMLQHEDLMMFGKLIFALCCTNVAAVSNIPKTLDLMSKLYSGDVKNVALFCLSKPGTHKNIGQLYDMIGPRLFTEMDDFQNGMDHLEGELMSELENARLVRLLCKFGFINERPEFARDPRWSETGDRYIIKLFRDYVFHQVDEQGNPVVNLSHVLTCLSKLDAGTDERIMLISRDEQSVLVVSYKDVKVCIESAFSYVSTVIPSRDEPLTEQPLRRIWPVNWPVDNLSSL